MNTSRPAVCRLVVVAERHWSTRRDRRSRRQLRARAAPYLHALHRRAGRPCRPGNRRHARPELQHPPTACMSAARWSRQRCPSPAAGSSRTSSHGLKLSIPPSNRVTEIRRASISPEPRLGAPDSARVEVPGSRPSPSRGRGHDGSTGSVAIGVGYAQRHRAGDWKGAHLPGAWVNRSAMTHSVAGWLPIPKWLA